MASNAERDWLEEFRPQYRRMLDRLLYVATQDLDRAVVDLWQDPEQSGTSEPVPAVTVRQGVSRQDAEAVLPSLYEGGLAWEMDPAPTPEERFMEAMRQGNLRARERMTGETGLAPLPTE